MKLNCWEYKKCGREVGGAKIESLGICPASTETRLDKTLEGINGGRCCWVVAGTLCNSKIQGTFARKYTTCFNCDFYKLVKEEESGNFQLSNIILQKLK